MTGSGGLRSPRRKTIQAQWMYDANGNLDKASLVEAYAPLVKRIAFQLMAKLPASVDVDDLIQNGMMGLLDALGRYEHGLGAQFETYAVQRIRGAMLDGLRDKARGDLEEVLAKYPDSVAAEEAKTLQAEMSSEKE